MTMKLEPKVFSAGGQDNFYQLPKGKARGLVAVFPGCARGVRGFWPWSPSHPVAKACMGFPEDVSHTKQILAKGYAILVLTPNDRTLCWTRTTTKPAQPADAIKRFRTKHGLESAPLYVLGASSGGSFATGMADLMHVDGAIVEVSTNNTQPGPKSPPTVWVTMQADETAKAEGFAKSMRGKGAVVRSPARALHPEYFSDYFEAISPAQSARMVDAMRNVGFLDARGKMLQDPKTSKKWIKAFKGMAWLQTPGTAATGVVRSSPVMQSLTAAYARHEHVATYTTAALTWFESGGSFSQLARDLAVLRPAHLGSGHAPTKPAKPAPEVPGPAPEVPGPAPTKPAPTPTKPAPTPTKPAPTPTKPAPTPTKPAPTPTKPGPIKPAPTKPASTKPKTVLVRRTRVDDVGLAPMATEDATVSNGDVTMVFAKRLAGACYRLDYKGATVVPELEGNGGSLQTAVAFDIPPGETPEVENPTEAGTCHDGYGKTSSHWIRAAGSPTEVFTESQMAYYYPPGEKVASSPHGTAARGSGALSDVFLKKRVTVGWMFKNVVNYSIGLRWTQPHHFAHVQILALYLGREYKNVYLAQGGRAVPHGAGDARDMVHVSPPAVSSPVIVAKDPSTAVGMYAWSVSPGGRFRAGIQPWYDGNAASVGYAGGSAGGPKKVDLTAITALWQAGDPRDPSARAPNEASFGIALVFGTVDEVARTIDAITRSFSSTPASASPPA